MTEDSFDIDDLYGFEVCLRDMDEMLALAGESRNDKALRYALVKTFELTFEMAFKALRKYFLAKTTKSDEAATFDFQDMIRLADQEGLVLTGWPEWKEFRANRSKTVHTYGEAIALQITSHLQNFSAECHTLLSNLQQRVGGKRG